MRKHFKWLVVPAMAIVMLFSVLLAACDNGTEYKLNRTSADLFVGKTVQLTVEPEADNVEWSTSDAAIATVSDGLVTAVAAGEAEITATIGETELVCDVTVMAVALESISVNFNAGGPTIKFYPSTSLEELRGYLTVSGTNNDGSAVSIDKADVTLSFAEGKTALEPGENTITVTYQGKTDTFTVNVENVTLESIAATFENAEDTPIYTSAAAESLKQYIVVTGTYSDESTAPISDFTVMLPEGGLKAGDDNTVTVTAGGKSCEVTVTGVQAVALASIEATFDAKGATIYTSATAESLKQYIAVSGTNNDGTPAAIEDFTVTLPSGGLQAGTNTVTVSVGSVQTTAEVTGVIAVALESIEATFDAKDATIYTSATEESLKQYITVSGANNDGSPATIDGFTVTLPEGGLVAGANTVTVAVGSVETTVSVEATAAEVTEIQADFDAEAFGLKHYTAVSTDDLKEFITVTATYSDGSGVEIGIEECELTLVEGAEAAFKAGENSVNVTYAKKTDTITVTLSADEELLISRTGTWNPGGDNGPNVAVENTIVYGQESDASAKINVLEGSVNIGFVGSINLTNPNWDIKAGNRISYYIYIDGLKAQTDYNSGTPKGADEMTEWTNIEIAGLPAPGTNRGTAAANITHADGTDGAVEFVQIGQWYKVSYIVQSDLGDTITLNWQSKVPNSGTGTAGTYTKNSEGATAYFYVFNYYMDGVTIEEAADPEEIIVKSGTSDPANSPNAVIDKTIVYSEGGSTASVKINATCASYFTGAISIQNVNWDIKTGDTISWYIRLENLKGYLTYNDRNNGTDWSDISIVALPTPIGGRATTTDMIDGNAEYVKEGQWYKVTYTAASDLGNTIQLNWGSKVPNSGTGQAGTFTTNSDGTSCYYFSFDAYIDCITITPAQA